MTFDLTDNWSVTGGARWFEFDRQEVESNEVPRGLPVFDYDPDVGYFLAAPLVSEGKDDDVVMKLATQYRFDDTKMLYALYSEGFRLGGTNSPRVAAEGRGTGAIQAGRPGELRARLQEPVARQPPAVQRLRCSSWNGRTSSCAATRATSIPGGWRESSTAARPSRRASSFRPSGSVNDRFSFERRRLPGRSRILGVIRHPGRQSRRKKAGPCPTRRRKNSGPRSNTACPVS